MSVTDRYTAGSASAHGAGRPAPTGRRALQAERCAAVACLLAAAWLGLRAESLVTQSSIARPGTLPPHAIIWLGAGVLGFAALGWTVQTFRRSEPVAVPEIGRLRDGLVVFVILAVGAWSTQWLGLLAAAGLTYIALLLFYRDRGKAFMLASTVAYLLVLHYGLEVLLAVPLPRSPLLPLPF